MKYRTNVIRWILASLALVPGFAGAGELGRCYSAEVRAAVVLPDGIERGPGRIRVCTSVLSTPVTSLHKVYWNGELLGLFPARRDEHAADEQRVEGAMLAFSRVRGEGRLVLDGYMIVEGTRVRTYALTPRGRVMSSWQIARSADPSSDHFEGILLAANLR